MPWILFLFHCPHFISLPIPLYLYNCTTMNYFILSKYRECERRDEIIAQIELSCKFLYACHFQCELYAEDGKLHHIGLLLASLPFFMFFHHCRSSWRCMTTMNDKIWQKAAFVIISMLCHVSRSSSSRAATASKKFWNFDNVEDINRTHAVDSRQKILDNQKFFETFQLI